MCDDVASMMIVMDQRIDSLTQNFQYCCLCVGLYVYMLRRRLLRVSSVFGSCQIRWLYGLSPTS